jgi:hypothetical protein
VAEAAALSIQGSGHILLRSLPRKPNLSRRARIVNTPIQHPNNNFILTGFYVKVNTGL